MKQQILPLKLPQKKSFENFFGATNQAIIYALKFSTLNSIFLWGNKKAGVSHLLQASCYHRQQQGEYVLYLDLNLKPDLNALLQGALEGIQLIAIDHLEAAMGKQTQEENLFHLFNHSIQASFALQWGAHIPPALLGCCLNDLTSRLKASLIFQVQELQDSEKKIALQTYAKERGFELPEEAAEFLLNHFPRDLNQLLLLLEKLDKASLQEHRRLTIPFLKKRLMIL